MFFDLAPNLVLLFRPCPPSPGGGGGGSFNLVPVLHNPRLCEPTNSST